MTVCNLTGFSVSVAVRAEVENEVAVIRKGPKAEVNQVGQFVHGLDVGVGSAEVTKQRNVLEKRLDPEGLTVT